MNRFFPGDAEVEHAPVRLCPVCCFIVPPDVLRRYSSDGSLDPDTRKSLQDTYLETQRLRGLREAHRVATLSDPSRFEQELAPHVPVQHVYDCKHRKNLPGTPVASPTKGFKTAFDTTAKVVEFYKTVAPSLPPAPPGLLRRNRAPTASLTTSKSSMPMGQAI